jgi:hypothetical protein
VCVCHLGQALALDAVELVGEVAARARAGGVPFAAHEGERERRNDTETETEAPANHTLRSAGTPSSRAHHARDPYCSLRIVRSEQFN